MIDDRADDEGQGDDDIDPAQAEQEKDNVREEARNKITGNIGEQILKYFF